MFCSRCGTQNADNAIFCVACGAPVQRRQTAETAPESAFMPETQQMPTYPQYDPPMPSYAPMYTPPKKPKKSKLVPILIGVLVIIIGSAAALFFTGMLDGLLGRNDEPKKENISGYYVLQKALIDGQELADEDLVSRDYKLFLQLNEDGSALFFNGSAVVDCTYDNGELKPSEGKSMAYRAEQGTLTLTTAEGALTFQMSEEDAPERAALEEALATPLEIGYFKFVSISFNGRTLTAEDVDFEHEAFFLLYEDGTAFACINDVLTDMCWENGKLYPAEDQEDKASYTVSEKSFTVNQNDVLMIFERSDDTPPDIEQLRKDLDRTKPGYYKIIEMGYGGITIDEQMLEDLAEDSEYPYAFLLLNDDGTSVLYANGALNAEMFWDETHIWSKNLENEMMYEREGDKITLSKDEAVMVFALCEDTAPDLDEVRKEIEEKYSNPTPSDVDLAGEYEIYACDMGSGMTEVSGVFMTLNSDGTGMFAGTSEVTWSSTNLKIGSVTYTYTVDEDGGITITGADGTFCFKRIDTEESEQSRWNGDWYGYWVMTDCTGSMAQYEDVWWDLCARSTDNGDGTGSMILWEEEYNSVEDPIGEIEFHILEDGQIQSSSGWFWMDKFTDELSCDPTYSMADDMIVLKGTYSDDAFSFTYMICIRPWGTKWDDIEEDYRPYYYDEWYLPLIEAGEKMPDTFKPS